MNIQVNTPWTVDAILLDMDGTLLDGVAVHVSFSLRFTVYDKPLSTAKPVKTTVTSIGITNPAGVVVASVVPGD